MRFIEVKGRAGVGEIALSENEYRTAQRLKGDYWNTKQHVYEVATKVRKIAHGCKWRCLRDLSAGAVQKFLADLRAGGLSI